MQGIILDVARPRCQLVDPRQDGGYLAVLQGGRHLEVVLGEFQVVFGAFSAVRLGLAKLAMISRLEFAFAFLRQFGSGGEDVICP